MSLGEVALMEESARQIAGKGLRGKALAFSRAANRLEQMHTGRARQIVGAEQWEAMLETQAFGNLLDDMVAKGKAGQWAADAQNFFDRASSMAGRSAMWRMATGGIGGAAIGGVPGAVLGMGAMMGAGVAARAVGGAAGGAVIRHRLANMMTLQKAKEIVDSRIVKAVRAFLRGGRKAVVPASATMLSRFTGKRDRQSGYRAARNRIAEWHSNPDKSATMLTANMAGLSHAAPESSTHATAAVGRVREYLGNQLDPQRPTLQPQLVPDVSNADIRSFAAKLTGAADPLGAIDDFGDLDMSYTEIQAFWANYPALASKLATEILAAVTEHKKPLTEAQEYQLSMFLQGESPFYKWTGRALARVQAVHMPIVPQARAPTAKGRNFETLGQTRMGAAQRMEMPV
jgi:hypothetical protein